MQTHPIKAAGFTLIELVMVIVILGILAAVATPKFVGLVDEATRSSMRGIVGSLSSASAVNYASCQVSTANCFVNSTTATIAAAGSVPVAGTNYRGRVRQCSELFNMLLESDTSGSTTTPTNPLTLKYIVTNSQSGASDTAWTVSTANSISTGSPYTNVVAGEVTYCYIFKLKVGTTTTGDTNFIADDINNTPYIKFAVVVPPAS